MTPTSSRMSAPSSTTTTTIPPGLGIGKDLEYFESNEGKLIDAKGEVARYVRLYSKGSTDSDLNHYIEVEVWGKPAK